MKPNTITEYIVNGVLVRYAHTPAFTPQARAERAVLAKEIENDMSKLEELRKKEAVLRAVLVSELKNFGYMVERAEFKIETRQWADGNPALDLDFERMKEAAEALMDAVDDIKHAEDAIEDKQGTLDDAECWKEGN